MTKYSLDRVEITLLSKRDHQWKFADSVTDGIEHTYEVIDGNLDKDNRWEFLLRVPHHKMDRTVVKPHRIPTDESYSSLEQRSLTFTAALDPEFAGALYCEMSLADSTGEHNRKIAKIAEAGSLPDWFAALSDRFHSKAEVNPALKRGGAELVALVNPDEHEVMLKLYMAMKPWILKTSYELPRTQ